MHEDRSGTRWTRAHRLLVYSTTVHPDRHTAVCSRDEDILCIAVRSSYRQSRDDPRQLPSL
jgi:hypothetical protein